MDTDQHYSESSKSVKSYTIDVRGFLLDPGQWDDDYAIERAHETKAPEILSARHWQILYWLRDRFQATGEVPSVYETCEANGLDIVELERLFPDGYHRGAVKLAGLRVR